MIYMVEYKLTKEEGKMLYDFLGKVLNHFELALKQFGLYAETLCVYDMLDTNDFKKLEKFFRNIFKKVC